MTSDQIKNQNLFFRAAFDNPGLVLPDALKATLEMLQRHGLDPDRYTINPGHGSRRNVRRGNKVYTRIQAFEEVSRDDDNGFFVHALRGEEEQTIHISPPFPRSPFQGFTLDAAPGMGIIQLRELVERISKMAELGFAGMNEGNYLAWQRCKSLEWYERKYGAIHGFNILEIENLDPPMNRVLDVSKNPGRIGSMNKMPVFVAADMWLGPAFWKYAPCTKEEVLKEPWVEVEDTAHYLYLKAYPQPFARPDGEQGRLQRRIWNVLFHQDCEWPPGSGGISDVPVGGPPELMP
jgi:hypothetical protein